jgi:hypothetical protein
MQGRFMFSGARILRLTRANGEGGVVVVHDGDSEDPNGNRRATVEAADRNHHPLSRKELWVCWVE